ncbi:MAG: hypothetical protein HOW73_20435 [Polyangiaceae bacterium]|nr:hypothetical protein [Polyangiaceae bacterium]
MSVNHICGPWCMCVWRLPTPPLAPMPDGLVMMTGDTLAAQTECQAILEHVEAERHRAEDEGRTRDASVLEGVRLWLHRRIEGR